MKKNDQTLGTTRRSFMKRSVVATVALTAPNIFGGLVDTSITIYYLTDLYNRVKCTYREVEHPDQAGGDVVWRECWYDDPTGYCPWGSKVCGVNVQGGPVVVSCLFNKGQGNSTECL